MNDDRIKAALRDALRHAEPSRREAAADFEAITARVARRRPVGPALALAGALAVAVVLALVVRPTASPEKIRAETPWLVVQVGVGDAVTDLRVRARFLERPTPRPSPRPAPKDRP